MNHGYEKPMIRMISTRSFENEKDTTVTSTTSTFVAASLRDATVQDDDNDSMSHSEYSDSDDSAALFAEDESRVFENEYMEEAEEEDDWIDEDIVQSSRLIYHIMLLLCGSSIIVTIVTLYFNNKHAQGEFLMAYEDVANDILDVVQARSQNVANVIKSISRTITSTAGPQTDWPFYTPDNLAAVSEDFFAFGPTVELVYSPIVAEDEREQWELYATENQANVVQSTEYPYKIPAYIYSRDNGRIVHNGTGPYSPVWQILPPPSDYRSTSKVNYNLLSNSALRDPLQASYLSRQPVISDLSFPDELYGFRLLQDGKVETYNPVSLTIQPIFHDFTNTSQVVAHIFATIPWEFYLNDTVAHERDQLFCVIQNSCTGDAYTYVVTGGQVEFYGMGDLHVTRFDQFKQQLVVSSYGAWDNDNQFWTCNLTLTVYPTGAMSWRYNSNAAATHLLALLFFVFVLVGIAIMTHHRVTDSHLRNTHAQGKRSKAIIASLFPEAIREKLFDVEGEVNIDKLGLLNSEAQKAMKPTGDKDNKIEELWGARDNYGDVYKACTVCIADICGFSAWSSSRDPSEVFTLLEAAFNSFDKIAKRRGAYKVETVGDAYVAVAGLPSPRKDHALVMAKFARDALNDFIELSNKLELSLGPETSDLGVRIGIASGPVLAGVLRGERARFQVFGPTVSKCTKLEEAGEPDRIHVAKETADLIKKSGFGSWVRARGSANNKKKKGDTFWLLPKRAPKTSNLMADYSTNSNIHHSFQASFHTSFHINEQSHSLDGSSQTPLATARRLSDTLHRSPITGPMSDSSSQIFQVRGSAKAKRRSSVGLVPEARQSQSTVEKIQRLVFWNSETLLQVLRHVTARRAATGKRRLFKEEMLELETKVSEGKVILQEVQEPIAIPTNNVEFSNMDASAFELPDKVEEQLLGYVETISTLYRSVNPYSNFEHASHITLHMQKLLSRVDETAPGAFGISNNPLVQFSMLLSTLVSAVDHKGVSNHDLCKENVYMAELYNRKSVAEQNAFRMAWQALMEPEYQDLRRCIYTDEEELKLFRSVLLHCVLSTDLIDEDLNSLRNKRWDSAFRRPNEEASSEEVVNLKGTAVIEHFAKAAAIAHTMQHWHVYCKWSQSLFFEQSAAFVEGRSENDPNPKWFEHETSAFESVVIPLARKLLEIKIVGGYGEEYLDHALSNKREWESIGGEILVRMREKFSNQYKPRPRRASVLKTGLKGVIRNPEVVRSPESGSGDECDNKSLDPALGFSSRGPQSSDSHSQIQNSELV